MKTVIVVGVVLLSCLLVGLVINNYPVALDSNQNQTSTTAAPSSEAQTATIEQTPESITPNTPPPNSIIVPDNYSTINQAVANAADGQTIFVRQGQYNESVTINKPLWLIGENQTLIDAHSLSPDLLILHDNVNVTGFTMQNTPTPATGSWIEQMQGIGLSKQLPSIQIVNSKSCNIYANNLTNGLPAIYLQNSSQNNIVNNNFYNNGKGLEINSSPNNYIKDNLFSGGGTAINLENSSSNTLVNNSITDTDNAISLDSSPKNILKDNTLTNNLYNFGVTGDQTSDLINNVDTSNTINGKPIYYMVERSNQIIPSNAGCIIIVNGNNITVQNSILPLSWNEIILANTTNSIVKANSLENTNPTLLQANYMPQPPLRILLYSCSDNQILNNQGSIWLNYSSSNTLTGNTGVMHLYQSNNNTIKANKLTEVNFDVWDNAGIALQTSSNNLIKQNTIANNIAGPGVSITDSANSNTISSNEIANNSQGGITITRTPSDLIGSTNPDDATLPRNNLIFGNTITHNGNQGILDEGYSTQIIGNTMTKNGNCGLQLTNSQNSTIKGNAIDGIFFGIMGNNTRNIQVIANNITINNAYDQYSTWLVTAYPATFYLNNFLGPINFSHFADNYRNSTIPDAVSCVWDNGSQGNYWQGYNGIDANGDGIGDTPYSIGFGYYDNYPLIAPYDISQAITSTPP